MRSDRPPFGGHDQARRSRVHDSGRRRRPLGGERPAGCQPGEDGERDPAGGQERDDDGRACASRVLVIVTDQHALTPRSRIPAPRWAAPSARTAARASPPVSAPVREARGSTAGSGSASSSELSWLEARAPAAPAPRARRFAASAGRASGRRCGVSTDAAALRQAAPGLVRTAPAHQRHARRGRARARITNAVANAASSAAAKPHRAAELRARASAPHPSRHAGHRRCRIVSELRHPSRRRGGAPLRITISVHFPMAPGRVTVKARRVPARSSRSNGRRRDRAAARARVGTGQLRPRHLTAIRAPRGALTVRRVMRAPRFVSRPLMRITGNGRKVRRRAWVRGDCCVTGAARRRGRQGDGSGRSPRRRGYGSRPGRCGAASPRAWEGSPRAWEVSWGRRRA